MKRLFYFFLSVIVCAFWTCSKDETDEKLAEEELNLSNYMKDNYPDAIYTGGVYVVKSTTKENGAQIEAGDYVLRHYTIYQTAADYTPEVIDFASEKGDVSYAGSNVDGVPELTLVQSNAIDEGIKHMKKGEVADIYVPSKYTYLDFKTRIWRIEIIDVVNELTKYQEGLMTNFLSGDIADTISVNAYDEKPYNVLYSVLDSGKAVAIDKNIAIEITAAYLLQPDRTYIYKMYTDYERTLAVNIVTAISENIKNIKKRSPIKKGAHIKVALPYKIVYENKAYTINEQYIVPLNSVVGFDITIKE